MKNPALWLLGFIFLIVGALFCMNDVIFPYVKDYYKLSYFQTSFIQWTFYLVYLPFPFFISNFVNKFGYKITIILSILITIIGSIVFYPSFLFSSYSLLLLSIFVISLGITILNVAANPYSVLLGTPEQSQLRINFVQVFARIGYAITPILGNFLVKPTADNNNPTIYLPYLVLSLFFGIILILFFIIKMPSFKTETNEKMSFKSILVYSKKYPHLIFGSVAMFFYVGAEASTASYFISYFTDKDSKITIDIASQYLTWYNILAGFGGFAGMYVLKLVSGSRLITILSFILIMIYGLVAFQVLQSEWLIISLGLFIAPMFPTIYGLSIEKLHNFTIHGAALVSIAIFGGAVFPPMQGIIADNYGVAFSYLLPIICFIVVGLYGICFENLLNSNK